MTKTVWPPIIQGGMGVAVSTWTLARAVSQSGQIGVVSGTGIDTVLVRRLQDGDPGGHVRRALAASPWPDLVNALLKRFYRDQGRHSGQPYTRLPLWTIDSSRWRTSFALLGGFVEVWLAKAEHRGLVGINLLTKVALPNLAVLYGAMQAGVDIVLMGAGIPREIPGALDNLARHEPARIRCDVIGIPSSESPWIQFNPDDFDSSSTSSLKRPAFFPIISGNSLATMMDKKANGSIEGFVVEGPTAGGHNAPPRGPKHYDALGQPLYTARDEVDWNALGKMGYPFWMAGGLGSRNGLKEAQEHGATGIQVGTLFAYCQESGLSPHLKTAVLNRLRTGPVGVRTDPLASPTGFPFKVVDVPNTLSDASAYAARTRICDLGYLREAFRDPNGQVKFRCASEPVSHYVKKGGQLDDTLGRKCLCNGLMAAAGFPQIQRAEEELPIVTSGDALDEIRPLLPPADSLYCAQDVINYLTS